MTSFLKRNLSRTLPFAIILSSGICARSSFGSEIRSELHNANRISNYAGVEFTNPSVIVRPQNLEELQAEILKAHRLGSAPVVALGSLYSSSQVFKQDQGTAIDMRGLTFEPILDENGAVQAGANMELDDLHEFLAAHGRSLAYTPMAKTATLAGLMATGSHGAHISHGHFHELVTQMKLVDGLGRFVKVDEVGLWIYSEVLRSYELALPDQNLLGVARKHIGVLGILYELSIRTQPAFDLHLVQDIAKANKILSPDSHALKNFFDSNYASDVFWFPSENRMVLRAFNVTQKKRKPLTKMDNYTRKANTKLSKKFFKLLTHWPGLTPTGNSLTLRSFKRMERIDRSDRISTYVPGEGGRNDQRHDMEYALPYAQMTKVMEIIGDRVREYRNPFPIYLRRCGSILYVEFHWPDRFEHGEETARRLERDFIAAFQGQAMPHDGKKFFINPWKRKDPEYAQKFLSLREYLDPEGLFLTDYKERYFSGFDS